METKISDEERKGFTNIVINALNLLPDLKFPFHWAAISVNGSVLGGKSEMSANGKGHISVRLVNIVNGWLDSTIYLMVVDRTGQVAWLLIEKSGKKIELIGGPEGRA
jgi:sulfur carrier protein ThiS